MARRQRQRMTWRERQASPPPATPGYGTPEMGDHPASQPDPGANDYENGDTSSWAEDPRMGPYVNSAPPATPGYGTEDQDHPARKRASIKDLVHRRAARAYRIASALLGPDADPSALDDKALEVMDYDDYVFDAAYQRAAGDFMGCGPEPMGCGPTMADQNAPDFMGMQDPEGLAMDDEEAMLEEMLALDMVEEPMEEELMPMAQRVETEPGVDAMEEEVLEEEVYGMDDMELFSMFPKAAALKLGFDENGFATKDDWKGDMLLFASLDSDGDDIVSIREMEAHLYGESGTPDLYADLDEEERAMLAAMESSVPTSVVAAEEEEEEEEVEEESEEEEEEEETGKEASGDDSAFFAMTSDPMGLSGSPTLSDDEDALLSEIFGGKTAAEDEEEEEEDEEEEEEEDEEEGEEEEEEEKEAGKKKASIRTASQRPRPRKPGKGPKTLGAVTKTASGKNEVDELSKLWASAPDTSGIFD